MNLSRHLVFYVMGVSGVGKSTVGRAIAESLNIPFFDGDDYHPESNIKKMNSGVALDDQDRQPWLERLNELAIEQLQTTSCVIACSALKQSYRATLKQGIELHSKFIFLQGSFDLINERLAKRDHFMPASLLQSQFDALEAPVDALHCDISLTPDEIVNQIRNFFLAQTEIGLIGLGVMGTSLARNLGSRGIKTSIYNRHVDGKEEDIAKRAVTDHVELSDALPFDDLTQFVSSLQQPRKILLMVNAGKAVDMVIEQLSPYLTENDTIIDGGNSHYQDTARRIAVLAKQGCHFVGAGISGGEQGALTGPSIMPSGPEKAYELVGPFLEAIAAKDWENRPCCTYVGKEGSGHFIKMVHNGIEYVEMQLLAEVYTVLQHQGIGQTSIQSILEAWKPNAGSYLLEISADIMGKKENDQWLLDLILDKSGNKGTGNWTTVAAAQLGIPYTMVSAALFARYLSSFKEDRTAFAAQFNSDRPQSDPIADSDLFSAYQFARLINHIQGFQLIAEASTRYDWNLNLSEIARIWTNGCIIRSDLMKQLAERSKNRRNLIFDADIQAELDQHYAATKKVVANSLVGELAIPALSDALTYFNGLKTQRSSANLIQAQRDYFGAHTYQRIDDPSGTFYHTNWTNQDEN